MNNHFEKYDVHVRAREILNEDFNGLYLCLCVNKLDEVMKAEMLDEAAMILVDDSLYYYRDLELR